VILVGGRGTRLGSLTDNTPKPLLSVNGRPFLSYVVAELARQGFKDILLLAGYQSQLVVDFALSYSTAECKVSCVIEEVPLGTGGALRNAESRLAEHFLLLNGDTLFDINLIDLTVPHLFSIMARIALRRVADTSRFGRVHLEGDLISVLHEKGSGGEGLINGGIYFLKKECLGLLPHGVSSLENDLFPSLIASQMLEGREYSGFFLDIGIPSDFQSAQMSVPKCLTRPAVFFDRDGVLNEDVHYLSSPENFRWIDGAKLAIKQLNDSGYYVFVVTNQAGVARGYYDVNVVEALHAWMQEELRAIGAHVDAFYFCPHHPDFTGDCGCRKPEPGMLLQAMKEWPIISKDSFLIGDKSWDIVAADRAVICGHLFMGGNLYDFVKYLISE
jgi:D-glycero-D-manno-heptose 1,7-bisphosphate phosphatase